MGSSAAAETGCGARCGPGGWRGRARVDDDGGHGRDEIDVVDRKLEDKQRNRSIYIGQDPLVPAGNTNWD